jgi:hypothetical protein
VSQPTTARCEAVRAWAYNLLMERPPGLAVHVALDTSSVTVSGLAEQPYVTVGGQSPLGGDFGSDLGPDDLAAGAGLLLGAADALKALSVRADVERGPSTTTTLSDKD